MANKKTRPLSPKILQDDLGAFAALKNISGYKPLNSQYEIANGEAARSTMQSDEVTSVQADAAAAAARDNKVASQREFHNFMLGVKAQVKAQFGDSSNEIQALGLKKKSEYKSPSKRKAKS